MNKVFIVYGKNSKEDIRFWVCAVFTSEKKAEKWAKVLDAKNGGYHYYFEETICTFKVKLPKSPKSRSTKSKLNKSQKLKLPTT